jgi:hypothetical protein
MTSHETVTAVKALACPRCGGTAWTHVVIEQLEADDGSALGRQKPPLVAVRVWPP